MHLVGNSISVVVNAPRWHPAYSRIPVLVIASYQNLPRLMIAVLLTASELHLARSRIVALVTAVSLHTACGTRWVLVAAFWWYLACLLGAAQTGCISLVAGSRLWVIADAHGWTVWCKTDAPSTPLSLPRHPVMLLSYCQRLRSGYLV